MEDKRRYIDTSTRYQGVYGRHSLNCALALGGEECNCSPRYYGVVWDRSTHCNRRTPRTHIQLKRKVPKAAEVFNVDFA
jgi:hypothetical protein